jgi:hypothetical protein
MRTCLIPNDGYTEQGFIAEVPGIHGEVRFKFRPMRCEVRSRVMDAMKDKKPAEQDAIVAKHLADHIVEWNVEDDRGKSVPVKIDTFRRLKPKLFYRLWDVVLGFDATDIDPAWGDDAVADHVDDLMEAADSPEPIGAATEARDAKNSEPA